MNYSMHLKKEFPTTLTVLFVVAVLFSLILCRS